MKIFLIIMMFHSNVGHLNSKGISISANYIEFKTMESCNKFRPTILKDTKFRIRQSQINKHAKASFKITADCKLFKKGR